MTALPTLQQLQITEGDGLIQGRDLYALVVEIVRAEAARIRQSQENLIKVGNLSGWEPGRTRAHHGLCAAAALIDKFSAAGLHAVEMRGKTPAYIKDGAKTLREALILELTELGKGVEIDDNADA